MIDFLFSMRSSKGSMLKVLTLVAALTLALTLVSTVTTPQTAYAVSSQKTKIHKANKAVKLEANAWNETTCPKDGLSKFICKFKTSAKAKNAANGSAKSVSKIRNTFTARCSGVGVSLSFSKSGIGAGASVSSTSATNYVQNTNKSIADKAGAVTCHIDPVRTVLSFLPVGIALKSFDRYTTGSYTEVWINGSADHTSWAWTW